MWLNPHESGPWHCRRRGQAGGRVQVYLVYTLSICMDHFLLICFPFPPTYARFLTSLQMETLATVRDGLTGTTACQESLLG